MSSGANILFPRSMVPPDLGAKVRDRRLERKWSQERLAMKVGVDRRTIMRIERGQHRPTSHLVHALEEVLDLAKLVPGWKDAAPVGSPSHGPRARLARLAAGLTIAQAASAAGVSPATLSRFELEMGDSPLILGPGDRDGPIGNERYALALGFSGAADMEAFCMASDETPWLRRIRGARSM